VPGAEARDRRVIGDLVGREHPEGDVLAAAPLDLSRGALPDRVGVEQERQHHLWVEGRPTPAILSVGSIERAQIKLADGIQHKPSKVILGQPLAQARRQKQLLVAVTEKEVRGHRSPPEERMLGASSLPSRTTNPGQTGVCATASQQNFSYQNRANVRLVWSGVWSCQSEKLTPL